MIKYFTLAFLLLSSTVAAQDTYIQGYQLDQKTVIERKIRPIRDVLFPCKKKYRTKQITLVKPICIKVEYVKPKCDKCVSKKLKVKTQITKKTTKYKSVIENK